MWRKKNIIILLLFFATNSIIAQKKEYTIDYLNEDFRLENYDRIIKQNSYIKEIILPSIKSSEEYINLVHKMYLVNTIKGNHSTSFEFAGLYLSFFEKDYQNYPQFYLNGLKYCAESAKLQNKNELVEDYTNLGINFLVHNKNQDHNEILFFLELDAETKLNLGKFNESILSYKKLMLEYIAKGIDDLSRISQCKFFMASSYLNLGLYQNAKELFEEILNSEKKEDDFILLLSKLSVYQCLVLSNKFNEAIKFSENLNVELKKKFGKDSTFYGEFQIFLMTNYCGIGEFCLKNENKDSIEKANQYFKKATILGSQLEKNIDKFKFSEESKVLFYSTMSLVQLFLRNIELSKKYAELSNNKALITLCLIQDNKPKEADLIFTELMDDLNKEFKVNSNLSIYDNLLLKRNLLVFNVTASMNYINYWKIKRPELVRFVFEKWINFNGDINTTNYLSDKNASELGRLKDRKNKIEENMLTPSKIKILKSCKDSISYLEQTLLSTIKLSHTKINVSDIQNKLTKDDIYIDIVQVPNFDFKKIKIVDGNIYNVFIVKRGVDDSINHILIPSEINMNFDNKNTDDLVLFYKYFWKPIEDKIGDAKTIYISLGGIYNNINLNTIFNPETGKYLLEEKDIRIVNSARDFILSKEKEKKNYTTNTASLFGFPNFDGNTTVSADTSDLFASTRDLNSFWLDSLTRGGMKAKPLPATKIEVENISSTLKSKGWQVNSFLADNASETNLKKQQSPRILHVATHGYFFQDIPIEKDNIRFLGMDRQQVVQDPMLRSGLLFTGANKTLKGEKTNRESGLLSAAEASLLDLRETELVVLSACETGKGEIKNSEGVYGLRKAFVDAGAQNIIMSLWKVDDKVTQEFMSRFYENWLNDKTSIREAFNKTQLEIKAKYPQPYYWGAFILVGE